MIMKKKYVRVGFTQAQKNELWERWRRGEQMKSIGRELCKPSSYPDFKFNPHLKPT